ncbi:hypothetical protein TTHERM_01230030 (macronuclear) [Tetrahymena thermophila SB210]|uniref:Uncharacterized protein n=1 Tax=Tetrahymena thermophila (strain SB210) TaxID=312017 RepID=Q22AF5_TETTS|nr:hypothetical protein TTHERM_01230030 [Tetrahymena thermophila SB210]EAR82261.2 hypothetical protein TTHERM_01230030 [Tetrahymena thermophila SB210]|eukprot:XP_001029924.2 hypothetical protein TTHERM_01230030 [Tetrahymena thermophila SB210]
MNEDTVIDKQTLIDYFDQFIQHAILKELKEQQLEKISNEWSYFKQLLEKLQQDPQRIPIYLDILKKSKETQGGIQLVSSSSNNHQSQTQLSRQPSDKLPQQYLQGQNSSNNQQTTSAVQVQSPLLNSNSSNLVGKRDTEQITQSKEQIQNKYQNQLSAQLANYSNKLGQQQQVLQSLSNQQSNQIPELVQQASNPLGFQQTNQASNQIKQENQQVKRKESTDIHPNNLFQNISGTSQTNTVSTNSKHSTEQNTQTQQQQQQAQALFLSKDRSSNSNLSSFNSGDQQNSFQSFSQEQQIAQQNYQKSINTTPVKIEPKSIFEEQKNKFRFQRDKIKSKVKSILNLFRENNIYLNKEDINENTENLDLNTMILNQQKQNGPSSIGLKKQQSDGSSISKTNNIANIQSPDINLITSSKTNLKIDQIPQLSQMQNQNLIRNNSSNNVNSQSISNTNNPILTYSNSTNSIVNQESFQNQQSTSQPTSSNFNHQNTNSKGANLSHFSNQNNNNNIYQSNNFNNSNNNNNNNNQQQMSNSKRNVFTQQININSQNQQQQTQISNQLFSNN